MQIVGGVAERIRFRIVMIKYGTFYTPSSSEIDPTRDDCDDEDAISRFVVSVLMQLMLREGNSLIDPALLSDA